MHPDIFYRRLVEFQGRAVLLIHRLVERLVFPENSCCEHLELLIGKVDTETLPPSLREREMASEQFRIVQVSFGVELLGVFVPVGMAIEERRCHADDRTGGYDDLLAVRVVEDKIIVRSHTVLAMRCARVQTECFLDESVQERQSAEHRWIWGLIWIRHCSFEFCSKANEDRLVVEDVEGQR